MDDIHPMRQQYIVLGKGAAANFKDPRLPRRLLVEQAPSIPTTNIDMVYGYFHALLYPIMLYLQQQYCEVSTKIRCQGSPSFEKQGVHVFKRLIRSMYAQITSFAI